MIDEVLNEFSLCILQFDKKPCTRIPNLYQFVIYQRLDHSKAELDTA